MDRREDMLMCRFLRVDRRLIKVDPRRSHCWIAAASSRPSVSERREVEDDDVALPRQLGRRSKSDVAPRG
ncbi:uncharacterized protein J3R85_017411 [Psidium guajava]|nr:uncharacterized protein J3R85_017411 [Psidium guajava]